MREKIKRLSLRVQLIIVICIILVPMNLLIIVTNIISTNNAEDRLRDSYINAISAFGARLKDIAADIDTEAEAFILKYNNELSQSTLMKTLSVIYIMEDLKISWPKIDLVSGAYFKNREDEKIYMTYSSRTIDYLSQQALVSSLETAEIPTDKPATLQTIKGEYFWVWNYTYNGYDFGYFISLKDVVFSLGQERQNPNEYVYILNNGEQILSLYTLDDLSEENVKDFCTLSENMEDFSLPVFDGCTLGLLAPREEISATMPLVIRVLQFCGVFAIILIPAMWFSIHRIILKPLGNMTFALKKIEEDHMDYRLDSEKAGSREIRYMEQTFNHMVQQIQDLRIEKYETEIQKMEIETVNIMLQINPHLLLNSLNLIASLAKIKDYDTIQRFSMVLAAYFRYSLRNPDAMVTVKEELDFVKNYLAIQKIRYPGTFTSVYDMDEKLENIRIPSLLIENFVENAIKYALKMGEIIEIIIIAREDGDDLVLSIIDNGNGMSADTLEKLRNGEMITDKIGKHIGIWNIRRRLKLIYGENFQLNISSQPGGGTQVWIKIPKEGRQNHDPVNR